MRIFCNAKDSHNFSTKINSVHVFDNVVVVDIRIDVLTTSLGITLNNWPQKN